MVKKVSVLFPLVVICFTPVFAICGALNPCTVVATANANTLIQAPTYSVYIPFDTTPVTFGSCYESALNKGPTTATIIVANPPQNPPPTAPVYMSLNTSSSAAVAPQVLLSQGSTVITSTEDTDTFASWFPKGTSGTSFTGVTIYSPGTPWVPSSITIEPLAKVFFKRLRVCNK